jgi:hypothetical protein
MIHTTIFMLGLFVLIVPTSFVNAVMISAVALFYYTISFVPKCMVITSAGFSLSQPSN